MYVIKYILISILVVGLSGCGGKKSKGPFQYFRNYQRTFNDLNNKHLKAARQWGIEPIVTDRDFDRQKGKLAEIGSCRDYVVDELTHSIPYLVPRAEDLLETIGRNFRDSLD